MKTALIVAMDNKRGIGKNNDLMWHLPEDMKFFKNSTKGHVVVMGRKNFESIPEKYRPLPGRENVIITRNESYKAEGCQVIHSLEELDHRISVSETYLQKQIESGGMPQTQVQQLSEQETRYQLETPSIPSA